MPQPVITDVVARALFEDVGDGDATTLATVPEDARARASITQKVPGVIFGLEPAEEAFREASCHGWEPQPGFALMRLAQGNVQAAEAAVRRVEAEASEPVKRARR